MKNKVKAVLSLVLAVVLMYAISTPVLADGPSSWAAPYVREAIDARLVTRRLQSNYTQPITRAEFATLGTRLHEVVRGITISARMTFNDTDDSSVQKMGALGIITGVGGGNFNPDGNITREQAAVMVVRLGYVLGVQFETDSQSFDDTPLISSWAVEAVGQAHASGLMSGTGNNMFSPKDTFTREQSIVTMVRLFRLLNVRVSLQDQGITSEVLAQMISTEEIPANVTHLDLIKNEITDISPLKNLTNLTVLSLGINQVNDLAPLSNLTSLRLLSLSNNNISDISPLSNLTGLRELYLTDNRINDISSLRSLSNLEVLHIFANHEISSDISALSSLTNLRELSISGVRINDFSPIGNLTSLQSLGLISTHELTDLSFLKNLNNLRSLSIHDAPNIIDYTPIGDLPSLNSINLSANELGCVTRLPLRNLTNIRFLTLSSQGITDISPLGQFTQLQSLRIRGNYVTDISVVKSMPYLQSLDISNNQVTDILPIFELSDMRFLVLYNNPITESQIAALLEALPDEVQIELSPWSVH